MQEYLATDEAQEILGQGAADIISSAMDAQLTQEQLSKLAGTVLSGYQAYAAEHGLADPAKIGDYFMEYLQTEEARRTLSAALAGMVDDWRHGSGNAAGNGRCLEPADAADSGKACHGR